MKNDVFRTIVSTKYYDTSGEVSRCFKNKNKMLWNYDGAIGVKTGYTKKSGRCLVSAAEKDGKSFAVVVLNVNDMWSVSENLLNEAFSAI